MKRQLIGYLLTFGFLIIFVEFSWGQDDKCGENWMYPEDCEDSGPYDCIYRAFWLYNATHIDFELRSRNGKDQEGVFKWFGIGFSKDINKPNEDMAAGWVENEDKFYVRDLYDSGRISDVEYNLQNVEGYFNEKRKVSVLKFSRLRETSDINDISLLGNTSMYFFFSFDGGKVSDPNDPMNSGISYRNATSHNTYTKLVKLESCGRDIEPDESSAKKEKPRNVCEEQPCKNGGKCILHSPSKQVLSKRILHGHRKRHPRIQYSPKHRYPRKKPKHSGFRCVCQQGYRGKTCEYTIRKRGECPMVHPYDSGVCSYNCWSDAECSVLGQKCCFNGCGLECVEAVQPFPRPVKHRRRISKPLGINIKKEEKGRGKGKGKIESKERLGTRKVSKSSKTESREGVKRKDKKKADKKKAEKPQLKKSSQDQ